MAYPIPEHCPDGGEHVWSWIETIWILAEKCQRCGTLRTWEPEAGDPRSRGATGGLVYGLEEPRSEYQNASLKSKAEKSKSLGYTPEARLEGPEIQATGR